MYVFSMVLKLSEYSEDLTNNIISAEWIVYAHYKFMCKEWRMKLKDVPFELES